ncbi:hypothetical protein C2845_PM08G10110 [Panicum miliaceum]|uniref:Uncharacterized protein n=1 Tax=Panicum miliaceum TaxID=4540 RepID=A0A3L6QYY8_PANMI|nr:hypothetical protein C2845_PM08G10110 [Panicum miliaceum]
MALDVFFATPPPPAITLEPGMSFQARTRRRRTYDMSKVLIDYINMYSGPLPQHIIAALSTFFGIHDEFATQLDEAMMKLAGVGVNDVQEVINDIDA